MAKPALGRGLGALLGGTAPVASTAPAAAPAISSVLPGDQVRRVAISRVRPSPFQPRKDFTPDALKELADSIREQGIVQPLIVREQADHLELIAGERRWRAAQLLGLAEVPVIVREADDRSVLELALIENLQRENLNPVEEALGYQQLIEAFQLRQEDVAAKVGKSRVAVANALRLLKLPPEVQSHLREGRITTGHAKVILGLSGADQIKQAATKILKEGLNVRQTESLVAQWQQPPAPATTKPGTPLPPDAHLASLENKLRERLGTKISLRYKLGKGALEIRFFSDADLERVLQILGVKLD